MDGDSPRVLVVEPHRLSALLLRRLLELRGYVVEVADSSAAAAIAERPYAHVFVDAALLASVRGHDPATVIATTARLRNAIEPTLAGTGVTRLLTKPIRAGPRSAPRWRSIAARCARPDVAAFEAAWQARDLGAFKRLAPIVGCLFDVRGLLVLAKRGGFPFADVVVIAAQACRDPAGIVLREYADRGSEKAVVLAACDRATNLLTIGTTLLPRTSVLGAVCPSCWPWFKEVARNAAHVRAWAAVTAEDRVQFRLVPLEADPEPVGDVDDLLRQVIANPDDRALRAVLADALLERDDPRGEIIRLGLELDAVVAGDPRAAALRDRLAALEAQHGPTIARDVTDHVAAYKLRGGFVDSITLTAPRFAKQGAALFAAQPIREVVIDPIDARAMATLAKAAGFPRIRALRIVGDEWRPRTIDFTAFAGVRAAALAELVVRGCLFAGEAFDALDAPALARVEHDRCRLDPRLAPAGYLLLAGPAVRCTALEVSCLPQFDANAALDDDGYLPALGPALERLATLAVTKAPFATDRWLAGLVARAPVVREVAIDACGAQTAAALAAIPTLQALTVLQVPTEASLAKLLASHALRSLDIRGFFQQDTVAVDRIARILLALPDGHPLRHAHVGGSSLQDRARGAVPDPPAA